MEIGLRHHQDDCRANGLQQHHEVAVPGHVRLLLAAEVRRHALPGGHLACTVAAAAWVAWAAGVSADRRRTPR